MDRETYKRKLDAIEKQYQETVGRASKRRKVLKEDIDREYASNIVKIPEFNDKKKKEKTHGEYNNDNIIQYNTTTKSQWHVNGAGKACVPISVLSCYWMHTQLNHVEDPRMLNDTEWGKIIRYGSVLWKNWKAKCRSGMTHDYPTVKEIIELDRCQGFRNRFGDNPFFEKCGLVNNVNGIDNSEGDLKDLFNQMVESSMNDKNVCCILVLPFNTAISIMCYKHKHNNTISIWMFDSHGKGKGKSMYCDLIECLDTDSVIKYIYEKHELQNHDNNKNNKRDTMVEQYDKYCYSASVFIK